jgi:phage shock protein PspC (stress-responsive transcriptional regulator)
MHKVITVALNDRLFQIDEPGYDALGAYLEQAERRLATNPDKAEIVRDLEQSIAEKCAGRLSSWKSVIASTDVEQVLREIGPVEGDAPDIAPPAGTVSGDRPTPPRRLYQIRNGAMISGVCNGIAGHLGIDPTLVRIALVAAAIIETAVADRPPVIVVGLYVLLVFIVPYAPPSLDRASHGTGEPIPQKVQHSVERIKGLFGRLGHALAGDR